MDDKSILIVEDDDALRDALADTFELEGMRAISVADGAAALDALARERVALVVSDVQMTPMDGVELLRSVKQAHPEIPVLLMTAFGTIQKAVEAMRLGASHYLVKPFDAATLVETVRRFLPAELPSDGLVACDPATVHTLELARRVATSDATVLLNGESGTGKEVFARFIHKQSARADGPFVAINCAAIPENMLEAVLFGHEKGAFTGASSARQGKFEQAQGGTLLLDEVSEMDLGLQAKLLRVLQERELERVGGQRTIALDVRVLATTNRDLRSYVGEGRFREDLYYRLNVFPLTLPALRERRDDIVPLVQHLIGRAGSHAKLTNAAQQALIAHDWPGNVRELDNLVQRTLILLAADEIDAADLCFETAAAPPPTAVANADDADDAGALRSGLRSQEEKLILAALSEGNGSRKAAAERLGISPRTLRYKIARLRDAGIAIPGRVGAEFA